MSKVYLAGKITGLDNYKELFAAVEKIVTDAGHQVMNPAVLPPGFEQEEYLHVCEAMIDVCDGVCFLDNWRDSPGARHEYQYAVEKHKLTWFDPYMQTATYQPEYMKYADSGYSNSVK